MKKIGYEYLFKEVDKKDRSYLTILYDSASMYKKSGSKEKRQNHTWVRVD